MDPTKREQCPGQCDGKRNKGWPDGHPRQDRRRALRWNAGFVWTHRIANAGQQRMALAGAAIKPWIEQRAGPEARRRLDKATVPVKQRPATQVRAVAFDFQEGEYGRLGAGDLSANGPLGDLEHAGGFVVGQKEGTGSNGPLEHKTDAVPVRSGQEFVDLSLDRSLGQFWHRSNSGSKAFDPYRTPRVDAES
jgi:hypothetical protein